MAAVALPPLDTAAGSSTPAKGGQGNGAFQHLQFDSARGAADKAAERDKLRNKLVDVGQRFVGFDKVIEEDTTKRRQQEVKKLAAAQDGLGRLEKAMNAEIRRRVEANKHVQTLVDHYASDMLQRLQSTIMGRIQNLTDSISGLNRRCAALETGMSQFRGELPSKLQVDTASLVKEISDLRRQMEVDGQQRVERDTALLRRLAETEHTEASQFDKAAAHLSAVFKQLKKEIDCLKHAEQVTEGRTEKFRTFMLQELVGMKNTLSLAAQSREQTDNEIVQAMNQYTNALQKGLHSANNR
eukprot:TRINITY_DN6326_c0_g1_i1.p1 TRINITY_DN6326_c0_g1~~TRINITY_DN6326_c0_g1_i1.p1  ORF type:complete len:298 (-),score=105.61 TRINITY_DN6326_c0_g1_i1:165-1058(-)